ncbi:MAG: NADP-dependent malic enzyme, partial [Bacteroidales bacterium]|nr:NADP-dependent malic enzyme [Bacteroidales bacterium]
GINLEDIKAPECFYIEKRLKENCDIPVMHDDQHGTAIISGAGLVNALQINGKKIEDVRIVVSGAGAAAMSCIKMYHQLGARKENIIMIDKNGVLTDDRTDLSPTQMEFATSRRDIHNLREAMVGADVFLGLSAGNLVNQDMVRSMADQPIVFALANPTPEISYEDAMAARPDVLMCTGRSDYPNQINNVIVFPYIFRGALDVNARAINEEMKIAAVRAIVALAHEPVPEVVNRVYKGDTLKFGPKYLIPKAVDPRLITEVSAAVAKAAMDTGVARKPITDWEAYKSQLRRRMGQETTLTQQLHALAHAHPQRVVFAEGYHPTMLKAAVLAKAEGLCTPILLGNPELIEQRARDLELDLTGCELIDQRATATHETRAKYARLLSERLCRAGYTFERALDKMSDRNYFGMEMVKCGDADAMVTGVYTKYSNLFTAAKEVIGIREGYDHFATMNIVNSKRGVYFIADTLVNQTPDKEAIKDIARLTAERIRFFNEEPRMAMISYSNFGSEDSGTANMMSQVVAEMHAEYPDLKVDGEMTIDLALDHERRDDRYPFGPLKGEVVNSMIFTSLSAGNGAYKLIKQFSPETEVIGPLQMGLNKPIHFIDLDSSVRDIVNIVAVAVIDAYVAKLHE